MDSTHSITQPKLVAVSRLHGTAFDFALSHLLIATDLLCRIWIVHDSTCTLCGVLLFHLSSIGINLPFRAFANPAGVVIYHSAGHCVPLGILVWILPYQKLF